MKISYKTLASKVTKTDLLIVFSAEGKTPKLPKEVSVSKKVLSAFDGKKRDTRFTDAIDGPAERVLLIGLGEAKTIDPETIRRVAAIAVQQAEKEKATSVTFWLDSLGGKQAESLGQALTEGAVMGAYRLVDFKSDPKKCSLNKVMIQASTEFNRGAKRGEITGGGNVFARRLQDTPANKMRPRDMAAEARKIAKSSSAISVKVLDEKAMEKLGMGSLLSVSRGSSEPAYLIHLTYKPTKKAKRKICFVGKGLTFDSGGISIKPSARMDEMKYDMSGGAAVLGAFHALAGLNPDVEVHGLVPTSENMVDASAVKPGDIVTASNGLTIEVLNTDAEGRLILADALAYADKTIKPDAMIDLATLTGAVVVALGHELTGVMGNNEALIQALVASGKKTSEAVWHLPMTDFHKKDMKGAVGDLKNIGGGGTGAGSSTAGAFLSHFVGETPWAHLDIAGTAWGATDRDYQGGPRGTGVGVRLLLDYIEQK
ncbi:MAG: leucyl aminopeptidase [Akkermansiaceae bacterium]